MKYRYYGFFLGFFFLVIQTVAQRPSFTFSDTYPTNNVDSLEQWLKTHPQPTEERLKNLIRLERTYDFTYFNRSKRYIAEISQLSQRLDHPVGKVFSLCGSVHADIKNDLRFLQGFEAIKDTSGIIYGLWRLVSSNYDVSMLEKGDKYAAKNYLLRAKQLLKARFDTHDFLIITEGEYAFHAGKPNSDNNAMLQLLNKALRVSESNPQYRYASGLFKSYLAIVNYYRKDYAASYTLNKEVLATLKPDQLYETVLRTQNLANDCEFLGRYDERLALCQKISGLIHKDPTIFNAVNYLNLYISFKEEMARRGRYKEALSYADSIVMIQDTIYTLERNQKLIEFQAENKQKQITELTLQKHDVENRNRFILTLLGIAVVMAVVFGYLIWLLRQSNARLNSLVLLRDEFIRIIAHDLRRPLHAFYGLSEVFSKLLQRGDQQSIMKLSQSIDQSGLYIRQMLDNLMYWALSQKGKLSLNFTTFMLKPQLEALTSVYGTVATLKEVELKLSCPSALTAYTDANALNLILRNLIDNATQHTPSHGSVSVEAFSATEHEQVHIRINDTGKGMTDIQLQLVREVLANPQQFHPKQDNLGLGLIIVSTFAKQAGIAISVESQKEKGTTFEIMIKKGS